MADGRSFSTTCDSALAAAVRAKVTAEKEREAEWWTEALADVHAIEDPTERTAARAELEAERLHRRHSGEYLASRDALLLHHLGKVLAEHGWDRKYPAIPKGAASVPGRRWGVELNSHRTGDRKGRLACNLPAKVWEQVRRAAYWTSAPHVRELQRWQARFGDGPARAAREGGMAATLYMLSSALGNGPKREDMDRRRDLRTKIITTGDILRMAARRATGG